MSLELEKLIGRLEKKGFLPAARRLTKVKDGLNSKNQLPPDLKFHPAKPDPEWWRKTEFYVSPEVYILEKTRTNNSPFLDVDEINRILEDKTIYPTVRSYLRLAAHYISHDNVDGHSIYNLGLNHKTVRALERNFYQPNYNLTIERILEVPYKDFPFMRQISTKGTAEIITRLNQYQDRLKSLPNASITP